MENVFEVAQENQNEQQYRIVKRYFSLKETQQKKELIFAVALFDDGTMIQTMQNIMKFMYLASAIYPACKIRVYAPEDLHSSNVQQLQKNGADIFIVSPSLDGDDRKFFIQRLLAEKNLRYHFQPTTPTDENMLI